MMTYRQRMLATLRGQPTDCLPFVPRLDLWYKSNKLRGTLPSKYAHASLMDIVEDLDVGYHTVVPDFQSYTDPLDVVDRALAVWRIDTMPFHTKFRGVRRNISCQGDTTVVEYLTPVGNITTRVVYDESMRQAGITLAHVKEHAIKSVADYDAVGYLFEHAEVFPNYEGVQRYKDFVGERGLCVGIASMGASPMHEILHELMPYDQFFLAVYDHPEELARLAQRMSGYFAKVFDIVLNSPAEIVHVGTNYDSQITWPDFMRAHVSPHLAAAAEKLHARGKYLLSHTDGENKGLLPFYLDGKVDIADSVCPAPMTQLPLKEIRQVFGGKITIWGGIPSVSVLENSMSDRDFDAFVDGLLEDIGVGDHLILSIADTAPPDMKFSRLEHLAKVCREFGQVVPKG